MRRRRPVGRKIYTVNYLLEKQPKVLKKHEKWPVLIGYLNSNRDILKIRFNKRCYSLLHNSIITPENLENFYRTYRLPKHPFFPLFFLIKREYLEDREKKRKEKEEFIRDGLSQLPDYVKKLFTMIALLEKDLNSTSKCPVYRKYFLPVSKKRINEFLNFSHEDWINFFDDYLGQLGTRYERLPLARIEYLDALLALQLIPDPGYAMPEEKTLIASYRKLSKDYHPDRGGHAALFIKVKWARGILKKQ